MCVHTYIYMYTSHGQVAHVLRAITMICPFEQKLELRVAMRGTVLFIPAFLARPDEWNWEYLDDGFQNEWNSPYLLGILL